MKRQAISFILVFACCYVCPVMAACTTPQGQQVDRSFLECVNNGYSYNERVDDAVLQELGGMWAHKCSERSVRVRIIKLGSPGRNVQDRTSNTLASSTQGDATIVSAIRVGPTYHLDYKNIIDSTYTSYVFSRVDDGVVQLLSLSQLIGGQIVDRIVAGRNVESGIMSPRLKRCFGD